MAGFIKVEKAGSGQVVESTGLVMSPYLEYPQLLGVLLRMLNEGEGSQHVRREVLKVRLYSLLPTCHIVLPTITSVDHALLPWDPVLALCKVKQSHNSRYMKVQGCGGLHLALGGVLAAD